MSGRWDNYVFPVVCRDKNAFECWFSRRTDRKSSWIDSFNISFLVPFLSLPVCLRFSLLNIYQYLIIGYGMMFVMFKEFWGLSVTVCVGSNRVSIQQSIDWNIVQKKKSKEKVKRKKPKTFEKIIEHFQRFSKSRSKRCNFCISNRSKVFNDVYRPNTFKMENILWVLINVLFILWFTNPQEKKLKSLVIKKENKKVPYRAYFENWISLWYIEYAIITLISWGINVDFQKRFISCQRNWIAITYARKFEGRVVCGYLQYLTVFHSPHRNDT